MFSGLCGNIQSHSANNTQLINMTPHPYFPMSISPQTFFIHRAVLSVSQVELNECVQCEFNFINTGKFNFSYQAELSGPKFLLQYLDFTPTDNSVDVGQSEPASLSFQPYQKCVLKGLELKIKVRLFDGFQTPEEPVTCCPQLDNSSNSYRVVALETALTLSRTQVSPESIEKQLTIHTLRYYLDIKIRERVGWGRECIHTTLSEIKYQMKNQNNPLHDPPYRPNPYTLNK